MHPTFDTAGEWVLVSCRVDPAKDLRVGDVIVCTAHLAIKYWLLHVTEVA